LDRLLTFNRPDVEESFQKDLKAITDVAQQYKDSIYAVTVGSETLYRGNFTGEELADKISTVKSALPSGIKVGTADSWNKFADGTGDAIIGTADIIMVNAFAFWQGASRENATVHPLHLSSTFQPHTNFLLSTSTSMTCTKPSLTSRR
jgi:glucan 1,3-beta-glucosidase